MKEHHKIVLGMLAVSIIMWMSIKTFLGSTEQLADSLTIRSTGYLVRDGDTPMGNAGANHDGVGTRLTSRTGEGVSVVADGESAEEAENEPGTDDDEAAEDDSDPVEDGELDEPLVDDDAAEPDDDTIDSDTVVVVERADSDADIKAVEVAEQTTSQEQQDRDTPLTGLALERAILSRLDPELLSGRAPTRAIDVEVADLRTCSHPESAPMVGVHFRYESSAIKGRSLTALDRFLSHWRNCGEVEVRITDNPQGEVDSNATLRVRRQEEVRYYLLQNGVPKRLILVGRP